MTRRTFALVCDEIEELLPSCDFFSLDVEMTSLEKGSDHFSLLDSSDERQVSICPVAEIQHTDK